DVGGEYQGKSEKQGLLTAEYEFFENKNRTHSGIFKGTLQTKWYLKENVIKYNDFDNESDGYFNNAFTGIWKMYHAQLEKICNWGDYRVPNVDCDFDVGTAEFSVNRKYLIEKGWLDTIVEPS